MRAAIYIRNVLIIVIVGFAFFAGCNKETSDLIPSGKTYDQEFKFYPADSGNFWKYDRLLTIDCTPDSIQSLPDSVFSNPVVRVTGRLTLFDSLLSREFTELDEEKNVIAKTYFIHHLDGFFYHAYSGTGMVSPVKYPVNIKPGKHIFHSLEDYFAALEGKNPNDPVFGKDSLFKEDPPVRSWVYPMNENSEWVYRDSSILGTMTRKVTGMETIVTPAGTFNCFKVKMNYSAPSMSDIYYYDYLSEVGVVKREIFHENLTITDPQGIPIGTATIRDVSVLTEYVAEQDLIFINK